MAGTLINLSSGSSLSLIDKELFAWSSCYTLLICPISILTPFGRDYFLMELLLLSSDLSFAGLFMGMALGMIYCLLLLLTRFLRSSLRVASRLLSRLFINLIDNIGMDKELDKRAPVVSCSEEAATWFFLLRLNLFLRRRLLQKLVCYGTRTWSEIRLPYGGLHSSNWLSLHLFIHFTVDIAVMPIRLHIVQLDLFFPHFFLHFFLYLLKYFLFLHFIDATDVREVRDVQNTTLFLGLLDPFLQHRCNLVLGFLLFVRHLYFWLLNDSHLNSFWL